jgi:TatD DNase family protein
MSLRGIVDSHCHLDFEDYAGELPSVIQRARDAGVETMVTIGSGRDMKSAHGAVGLAEKHPFIWATIGVHPHDIKSMSLADWSELAQLARHPRVVAIGETGLDYHYDHSPRVAQKAAFERFAQMAKDTKLPLVIHVRDAHGDCADILRAAGGGPGVIHCFTGGPDEARLYLTLGFHISFSGIVTFKNAQPIREAAKLVPKDRILVETDAPYLAPIPHRGKRNEPGFIVHTIEILAQTRDEKPEDLAAATAANARALFNLDRPGESD